MASSSAPVHPARYLSLFLVLLVGAFLLVFLTGDKKADPKLGIDLQGGTRVTLTARTPDGSPPTRESLAQAQQIISARVDGLGVSGSEVVIDGDNLVITVPGNDSSEARNLGQTARLYIRPVVHAMQAQPAAAQGGQPGGEGPASPASRRRPARRQACRRVPAWCPSRATRRRPPTRHRRRNPGPTHSSRPLRRPILPPRRPRRRPAPGRAGRTCAVPRTGCARRACGPRAAHRRREATAPEHRSVHPAGGTAVPGHPLRRGRRARRQRRPEPAADHLLDRRHRPSTC